MEWLALDIEFVRKHGFKKMCSEKAGSQGGENVSKVRTKKSAEQVDPKHVPCVKVSALRFHCASFVVHVIEVVILIAVFCSRTLSTLAWTCCTLERLSTQHSLSGRMKLAMRFVHILCQVACPCKESAFRTTAAGRFLQA